MAQNNLEIKLSEQDAERFWKKVAKRGPDDCWIWLAGKRDGRYGGFSIGRNHFGAHRIAFGLTNSLDAEKQVLHTCDIPLCCNPRHLYAGTRSDNMRDAYARRCKLPPGGSENGRAKLIQVKVDEIRRLYAGTNPVHGEIGSTQRKIARMFGVSESTVWLIVHRKTWVDKE